MRGIVTRAPGQTGRRSLSGIGQRCGVVFVAAAALLICVFTPASSRAGPPPGGADAATTPAPNTVAPGATGAAAPGQAGGAGLVISGLDERTGSVRLLVNKSTTLVTGRPYKRLSVGQPDIAEVNGIGPTRILVTGKKAGATQIIVWDEEDNSQQIDVLVQANLLALRGLYERLLPGSQIDVIDNEDTIALT